MSEATIIDLGSNRYMVKGTLEAKNAYGTYVKKALGQFLLLLEKVIGMVLLNLID